MFNSCRKEDLLSVTRFIFYFLKGEVKMDKICVFSPKVLFKVIAATFVVMFCVFMSSAKPVQAATESYHSDYYRRGVPGVNYLRNTCEWKIIKFERITWSNGTQASNGWFVEPRGIRKTYSTNKEHWYDGTGFFKVGASLAGINLGWSKTITDRLMFGNTPINTCWLKLNI